MKYQIITKQQYYKERKNILVLVTELFKNDASRIANFEEFSNHLDYLFAKDMPNDSFLILNVKNGKILAMVNFLQYNNVENLWCLFSVFTLKSQRRKGYAEDILNFGINEIKKKKAKYLLSGIEAENIPSIKLHEKVGFKYTGKMWNELAKGFPEKHLGYIYEFYEEWYIMMKSKYFHCIKIKDDIYAVFNSLILDIEYISKNDFDLLTKNKYNLIDPDKLRIYI